MLYTELCDALLCLLVEYCDCDGDMMSVVYIYCKNNLFIIK